ncbi:unnamed protein product, partial [Rotaria socialis]
LAAIVARVVFTAAAKISPHPGRGRTAGNGRKAQESAGEWKQYSSWKLPDFFLVDSDQLPDIRPHHSPSPPTLNSSTSSNNTKVGEESRSIDPTSQNLNSLPTKVIIPQPQIQPSTTPNLIFSTNTTNIIDSSDNSSNSNNENLMFVLSLS